MITTREELIESVAKAIALAHGAQYASQDREGQMQTFASRAGFGRWGHSPDDYANANWKNYRNAASFALAAIEAKECRIVPTTATYEMQVEGGISQLDYDLMLGASPFSPDRKEDGK